ncbi:hypothetical protein EST38_g9428 [Candolleomyces aberdarensis]|uniref:Uncharacterized protein n=1 Tax=Candolleomyces aberdarensis TaxID=2316362 RepID=A0A4Q2DA08_9AGAR|nr:hypothetical protein EST38_g9428 [Candolleomyces aberdarensis]
MVPRSLLKVEELSKVALGMQTLYDSRGKKSCREAPANHNMAKAETTKA